MHWRRGREWRIDTIREDIAILHQLMSRPRKTARERMSEWVLHCAVDQRHIRRSQPTREAALKDACAQLLQGHAVNRIVGPSETITAERVRDWCAKHRPSFRSSVRIRH